MKYNEPTVKISPTVAIIGIVTLSGSNPNRCDRRTTKIVILVNRVPIPNDINKVINKNPIYEICGILNRTT